MFLSKRCQYAIRAMRFMASSDPNAVHQVRDIASAEGIPQPFLGSILHQLVKARLLRSFRGPVGGFQLIKSPEQIFIAEIVEAIDGLEELEACALLKEAQPQEVLCSLSARWREICRQVLDFYRTTNLAELVGEERGNLSPLIGGTCKALLHQAKEAHKDGT